MIIITDIKNYKTFWKDWKQKDILPRNFLVEELMSCVDNYCEYHQVNRILELGSGFGRTRIVGRIGIDINENFLKDNRITYGDNVVYGNIKHLPFKDNSFELIYCGWVLMHIHPDDINAVAEEIKRVGNGSLIMLELGQEVVSTFCFNHPYYNLFGDCVESRTMLTINKPKRLQLLAEFNV